MERATAPKYRVYLQDLVATIPVTNAPRNNKDHTAIKRIVISFVVCDSRFKESLNVVKSVLLFTKTPVHFVIFTEDELIPKFQGILSEWRDVIDGQLSFELHLINFPEPHGKEWLNLFKKCSSQRLFMPELLTHLDALIYVDIDTLFLGPADELWGYFSKFNSSQLSAMALEHENPNLSWYPRFAQHPFYGTLGLNSGVMLMNLTRLREFGWEDYITPIMLKWKEQIPWGDQDILNILFAHHGSRVLELPCRYNYRTDQCMYGDACTGASSGGVYLLHGSRQAFHSDKHPAFQAVYRAVDEYEVGMDPSKTFLPKLEKYFLEAPKSSCGNLSDTFLKVPRYIITKTHVSVNPDRSLRPMMMSTKHKT
ncbi:glycosyl transferase family 8 domain-containing protein [Phthorimaea operculella]|nr:glycosyl transferase family 8 domain-containing protein [Phthorimaea operculella]